MQLTKMYSSQAAPDSSGPQTQELNCNNEPEYHRLCKLANHKDLCQVIVTFSYQPGGGVGSWACQQDGEGVPEVAGLRQMSPYKLSLR